MDQKPIELMLALLRSTIRGDMLTDQERAFYSEETLSKVIAVAKKHDLAHLLAPGLERNGLDAGGVKKHLITAIYRYETLQHELNKICDMLEDGKIDFIPLKGSVIRTLYPEPWMRTSCDIDILVHEEDLDRTVDLLVGTRGYEIKNKSAHDVSLFLGERLHLELHYTLVEKEDTESAACVLEHVWEATAPKEGKCHWREMTDEMFYFYHIAHMAKHFVIGGCGIKPFVDLWILDSGNKAAPICRDVLLKQGGLLQFADAARLLSQIWFDHAEHTDVTRQMENYILRGGVYGVTENRVAVQQQKQGGQFHYAVSRIFLPYDVIKFHYPVLRKYRWLAPIMQVRRWFKILFDGRVKSAMRELKTNQNITQAEAENIQIFLQNIGLS